MREQRRFNTLTRQIEQASSTLATWNDNPPLCLQAHTKLIAPPLASLSAERSEQVFALDELLGQPGWHKAEQATLREVICECVADMRIGQDEPDAALQALFGKHGEVGFATEQQASRSAMKVMLEAMTGPARRTTC